MQIRQRKNRISLVRSVYDPARKRCRAVTIGTLPIGAGDVPAALWEKLLPEEQAQIANLCAANRAAHALESRHGMATVLPETLREVAAWYRSQPQSRGRNTDLARLAETSRAEWTQVLSAMCAAGVGRTRKRGRS